MNRRWKLLARLVLEQLEGREVPATFNIPWADPMHLTASFAPDGTSVDGAPSNLDQSFDAIASRTTWETQILKALQTWSAQTNVNIGLVADGGQPINSPGQPQGDPRSGDIR